MRDGIAVLAHTQQEKDQRRGRSVIAEDAVEIRSRTNAITGAIIRAACKVHSAIGLGLLESAYEACLARQLELDGLRVARQVGLPVTYEGVTVYLGYRIDLVVEDAVIVELKAIEAVLPVHKAQLLSHVRLSGRHVGLLINFHVEHLKDGVTRVVDKF